MTEELNGGCLDEREAFEAWIRKDAGDLSTFGSGENRHYRNSAVNNAWGGWKERAARAASRQEGTGLSAAVFTVLEGFTLPPDVRKILECAYYSAPQEDQGDRRGE